MISQNEVLSASLTFSKAGINSFFEMPPNAIRNACGAASVTENGTPVETEIPFSLSDVTIGSARLPALNGNQAKPALRWDTI